MTRYLPSRHYLWAGIAAWALAAFSGWVAIGWPPAGVALVLFLISSSVLIFLALRPPVEVREIHLIIGNRAIPWTEIQRVDRTGWLSPLVVHLTLFDESRILLIYPGDPDSSNSLLRHIRRHAREALIDGIPHQQFWGDVLPPPSGRKLLSSPKYRLLRPEDEDDVERLYQRLKSVRHLDPDKSPDEN